MRLSHFFPVWCRRTPTPIRRTLTIILACLIYSAFLSTSAPAVDATLPAVTMAWQYIGQLVFNMLVLTALVKGAERIVREMFGL